jgi:hypothetical protein
LIFRDVNLTAFSQTKDQHTMTTASKLSLAVVALFLAGATVAQAQSANINATATVQTPLTLTGTAALAFGNVFPGLAKTVLPTDAASGRFTILGQPVAEVAMTFTLPTNLTFGANNLPIGTWAGLHNATNVTAGATAFTPSAAITLANLAAVTGNRFLFIGATVTPAVAQAAGAYTGTITLNVLYTGN